ncbi:MAG: hypothetical protein ACK5HY_13745 [Parahaliea sp.]
MLQALASALGPWYPYIKFVHLTFVMVWIWSTALAYAYYLVPVFKAWRRNPQDTEIITLRNWAIERFDQGVIYEHVAFPIILLTGPLLYLAGGWSIAFNWLALKICIVILIMIPIEVMDYHLSHFGGNKATIRATGDMEKYEKAVHLHWYFFLYTSPVIMTSAMVVVFLATTKSF